MNAATTPQPEGRNRLLASLPPDEFDRLRPQLELVELGHRNALYETEEPIAAVYFPLDAVASLMSFVEDRPEDPVEVASAGRNGMVGLPLFLGAERAMGAAICQIPGQAFRAEAGAFRTALAGMPGLRTALQRYTNALITHIAQGVACCRLHPVHQQCARWLLLTYDQVDGDRLPLTHELMAQLFAVRRATVTQALGGLQRAGLLQSRRGWLTLLDRPGLEAAACSCYAVIRREYDRYLAPI